MKNILLLIHDDDGQEARFQAALDIARAIDGHITCLDLTIIPEYAGDYIGKTGIVFVDEQQKQAANRPRMRSRIESEDVPFDWIDHVGFIAQSIEAHAGLIDLMVLSGDADGVMFPRMADVVGDLLMKLAKPILLVPAAAERFAVDGRALVAWDGSDNAEAALQAAVPLLQRAGTVTLLYVDDRSLQLPIEDAARYLSRHGMKPIIKQKPAGAEGAGKMILTEAVTGHHDYMVMGAYARGQTLEKIFGGATLSMMKKSPIPVLLAHRR